MQRGQTHLGRVCKSGANCVKHAQWFNLTSIRLLVDCNGGVNVCPVLFPVADMFVDPGVIDRRKTPCTLIRVREALLDAFLGCSPTQTDFFVSSLRAVFVDNRVALLVEL